MTTFEQLVELAKRPGQDPNQSKLIPPGKFAEVVWMAGDVQDMASGVLEEEWSEEQAEEWLQKNAKYIQEALVKRGYDVIADLLLTDR